MREEVTAEIARVEALQREVEAARGAVPEALGKIRLEVEAMSEQTKRQSELIEKLKAKSASAEELKAALQQMEGTKLPDLSPLTDVLERVKQKKD